MHVVGIGQNKAQQCVVRTCIRWGWIRFTICAGCLPVRFGCGPFDICQWNQILPFLFAHLPNRYAGWLCREYNQNISKRMACTCVPLRAITLDLQVDSPFDSGLDHG
jgi:hypothetical protein